MPRLPKWLGDFNEKYFSQYVHSATLTKKEYIDKDLLKLHFEGEELKNLEFIPGQIIQFRITETDYRRYTISFYDREKGVVETLVYVHGTGLGVSWIKNLEIGMQLKFAGPVGKINIRIVPQQYLLFGDETSIGSHLVQENDIVKQEKELFSFIELDDEHKSWTKTLGIETVIADKSEEHPAEDSIAKIDKLFEDGKIKNEHLVCFLTGRMLSVKNIKTLLQKKGINKKQIISFPYWADGKCGL